MNTKTIELVVFELNEGVTHEEFMSTVPAVSEWVSTQPGFVSRELVYSPEDGKYIEIVWWRSRAEADAAAEAALSSPTCAPMFGRIAMDSMLMLHGDLAEQLIAA
jgi:hypothetical protein